MDLEQVVENFMVGLQIDMLDFPPICTTFEPFYVCKLWIRQIGLPKCAEIRW